MFHLSGDSERFDEWDQANRDARKSPLKIELKLPPQFLEMINELRLRDDDEARWIAFALLGLSQDTVEKIENDLGLLRKEARSDGRFLRITLKEQDLVVSFVSARAVSINSLRRQVAATATTEKYRRKVTSSVAIGIDADDTSKPFDFAIWIEHPWKPDPELEKALEKERPNVMPGQKLPGRNDPCPCGSGRKFKKCCIDKFSKVYN